jgi:hypothetical protein
MITVIEMVENDDLYCCFIQLMVVNSRKWNVWKEPYYGHIDKYSFSNELFFSIIELIKSLLNSQKYSMLVENESASLALSYWQNIKKVVFK